MSIDIYDAYATAFDHGSPKFRKGIKTLEAWHEQCRKRRIEAAIAARKKELAAKRIAAEQNRLLAKHS